MKRFLTLIVAILFLSAADGYCSHRLIPDRFVYNQSTRQYAITEAGTGFVYYKYENETENLVVTELDSSDHLFRGNDIAVMSCRIDAKGYPYSVYGTIRDSSRLQDSYFGNHINCISPNYPSVNFSRITIDTVTQNCIELDAANNTVFYVQYNILNYIDANNDMNVTPTKVSNLQIFPGTAESPVDLTQTGSNLFVVVKTNEGDTTKIYKYGFADKTSALICATVIYKGITGITSDNSGNLYLCGHGSEPNSGFLIMINTDNPMKIIKLADNLNAPSDLAYIPDQNAIAYSVPDEAKLAEFSLGAISPTYLLYPSHGDTTVSCYCNFRWNAARQNNAQYDVEIAKDSDLSEIVYSAKIDTCGIKYLLEPQTNYFWRVRARCGDSVLNNWSPVSAFTTNSNALQMPDLILPIIYFAATQPAHPKFKWKNIPDADEYEMYISTNPKDSSKFIHITAIADTSIYLYQTLLAGQKYYWKVRGIAKDTIKGAWSGWHYFVVKMMLPDTVRLFSPADSAIVPQKVKLIWQKCDYADSYMIHISKDYNFTNPIYKAVPFFEQKSEKYDTNLQCLWSHHERQRQTNPERQRMDLSSLPYSS